MRAAVVGHVETVEFVRVDAVPRPGEIVHARESFTLAAGGGAVAAVQLARLGAETELFTALGDDELGRGAAAELAERGLRLHVAWRSQPQRRAFTFLDSRAERTITILGERLAPRGDDELPWPALAGVDAVYFTAGDTGALRAARAARKLVATPRAGDALACAGVALDALVLSASDAAEQRARVTVRPSPDVVVTTAGAAGGRWETADGAPGAFAAARLPGEPVDAYGCGDSFAAGLTYGLGDGRTVGAALELAARCGAACVTGAGPYTAQLATAS